MSITCYYTGLGKICQGGGDFDQANCGVSDTDNGATILQDFVGHCFYRKNFGLNGIVDARQCGVVGDGLTANDVNALITCMNLAAANHIYRTFTGGGIILDDHMYGNITPPQGMELTCAINAAADLENNNFRSGHGLDSAIVLDLRDTIALSQDNASVADCNIVAGATGGGADGTLANPFSPSIWYPDCDPGTPSMCDDSGHIAHLRSAIDEYSAFNPNPTAAYHTSGCGPAPATGCGPASMSVGITITGSKNAVRNVTVMGFGTGYKSTGGGKGMIIDRLTDDSDAGISIDSASEATQISGFQIKPFLTNGNGDASLLTMPVTVLQKDPSSSKYAATVVVGSTATPDFTFQQDDTVWIATSPYNSGMMVGGAESAAGRWKVGNVPGTPVLCSGLGSFYCQTLVLDGSMGEPDSRYSDSTSPLTVGATSGVTLNSTVSGVPPNAITGISTDPANADQATLQLIAVGQTVTDGGVCIPSGTTVANVWPAKGIVYLSQPVLSTCPANTSEAVNFYDAGFHAGPDCSTNSGQGCAIVSANERFGDGIVIADSGGVSAVNCQVYEHLLAYHFSTNANSSRFANCSTGENIALPDQDIIGLLIDGNHSTATDASGDACGNEFVNGVLGQHHTVGVVVKSNCATPNHLSNVRFGGNAGGRRNAVSVEVDAGAVTITNGDDSGSGNFFKADKTQLYPTDGTDPGEPSKASLSIGNNQLPNIALVMANSDAATSTTGCGNTFIVLTPYKCTPPPASLLPGGRLALPAGTHGDCTPPGPPPVMKLDAKGAECVFYLPYRGQQVPIYDPGAAGFGLADIGATALTLPLDSSSSNKQMANTVYDIFVETVHTGSPELCVGPAWMSGNTARSSDIQQVQGVWVNAATLLKCQYDSGPSKNFVCPALQCTYLGSMYMTADGQTTQQFGPNAAAYGAGNCICLYNAYNRVPVISVSRDSNTSYTYGSTTWRDMDQHGASVSGNRLTFLDGLGETAIDALLGDAIKGNTLSASYPRIGLVLNSTTASPDYYAQNQSATTLSVSAPLRNPPLIGLWYVQAMESTTSTGAGTFGGDHQQQMSVHVAD